MLFQYFFNKLQVMYLRIELDYRKTWPDTNRFDTRFFKLKFNEPDTTGTKHVFYMYGFLHQNNCIKKYFCKNNVKSLPLIYEIL